MVLEANFVVLVVQFCGVGGEFVVLVVQFCAIMWCLEQSCGVGAKWW